MEPNELAHSLDLPKRAVALVLAGGRGSRLNNLTDTRAKPAVYFGGKFRIVDFALSNCLNSGIRRIGVITQYKSHSLLAPPAARLGVPEERDERVRRPAAGAAACRRGILVSRHGRRGVPEPGHPRRLRAEYVVVLAGDHIYKMNYALMLADHVARGRECTVGCIAVPRAEASAFGVMAVDANGLITDFVEKPADPPAMPGDPTRSLASMGIYVFNARYLYAELARDMADPNSSHDFGKDIIPHAVRDGCATAHPFALSCVSSQPEQPPYWRDVGTIDAYWDANIDLTATAPLLDLYDRRWPIWTYQPQLPPAKFVHNQADRRGMAIESMVSGGCIISGAVFRSVLFSSVRVHSHASVNWAVLLPDVQVGRRARLSRVVVDRGCTIPDGLVIGEDAAEDARRFHRSAQGITLVTRDMLAKLA